MQKNKESEISASNPDNWLDKVEKPVDDWGVLPCVMSSEPHSSEADLRRDIAKLNGEIIRLKASRDEAVRAKDEYMQNVAHQLAAPINAIKLNIESVKSERVPAHRRLVLFRSIYAQGTILAHLVKNFSLMSHLDKDHNLESFSDPTEDVDLYRLCINFANDFQPMGETKDQKITVLEEDFARLGHPKIKLIKNLFAQVIYNLLENAIKYGDADTPITIGLRRTDNFICILIKSIGHPISPGDTVTIFNRGVRGSQAKRYHPAGTGFGLFIARRIIEIHEGTISVDTQGKATTFIIKLPRK